MKDKRKLLSMILCFALLLAIFNVAIFSASAAIDENGAYIPSEGVEDTHRYYFAMPSEWYNEYSNSAGIYWWAGSDACGPIDDFGNETSWPGYKAQSGDLNGLFYVDCPTNVPAIIWNNYIDGGNDITSEIYNLAEQAADISSEFYIDGDSDVYTTEFFKEMEASYYGDKKLLGDFADNFFIDEQWGFSFNFDNMIYIVDPDIIIDSIVYGKHTYYGEWYFYYGDGTYGVYPTKDASINAGVIGNIFEQNMPTLPNQDESKPIIPEFDKYICFDVDSTGWQNVKNVYCHIWRLDGGLTTSGVKWPEWQSKPERCEYDKNTGIATYDLSKTYNDFNPDDGKIYGVIFSANTGHMTYTSVMNGRCIGDTLYCTGSLVEQPKDEMPKVIEAVWRNNPDCGPLKQITSTGEIIGSAYVEGANDASLIADYLIKYYDDPEKTACTQDLLNTLDVEPDYVMAEVYIKFDYSFEDERAKAIYDILKECDGWPEYKLDCGDVNGDGKVNVADATEIQKAGIGLVKLTAEQAILADVNNDGRVSVLDTTMIQKFSVGLITKF